jgi:hypothetical protein
MVKDRVQEFLDRYDVDDDGGDDGDDDTGDDDDDDGSGPDTSGGDTPEDNNSNDHLTHPDTSESEQLETHMEGKDDDDDKARRITEELDREDGSNLYVWDQPEIRKLRAEDSTLDALATDFNVKTPKGI